MEDSNGHIEPTEVSPLLTKDSSKAIAATSVPASTSSIQESPVKAVNGAQSDGTRDEEAGEGEEPLNPLFEGLPDAAAQLHILAPAVAIGIFLAAADQTIIVSTYGKIGSELNALNSTSWIATAYFLTATTFQPLYGKLSDIFGRKPTLLFAYTVFGLGCLFCGLARTIEELIAARAFAGIGGGGMMTVTSIMFSDIIPLRKRGTWQGYMNIIFATGAATGAPLGGIFADSIGWRWLFIAQAPLVLVAFLAVYFVLHLPPIADSNWREKLAQIDFLGAFCLVAATSTLLLGFDRGSNIGWSSTTAIVCLAAAIPLFIVFILVEMKWASNPFAPGRIIFERSLIPSYLCNFFSMAGYMGTIFYIPLFFQVVDDLSAFEAGLRLIPGILFSVFGSIGGGIIMQKTGKFYWVTVIAYILLPIGSILIVLFTGAVVNSTVGIIAGLMFCGLGGGTGVTTTLIALIANADPKDQAIATACSYLFRSLGSVIGLSISATIVQQSLRTQLREKLTGDQADKIVERVRQNLEYIGTLDPDTRELVRSCYENATTTAFVFTAVIVLGSLASSIFIIEKKLSK